MIHPLRDRIRKKLLDDAVAKGADPEKAKAAIAELEGERPLLDWLLAGGFDKLLELILAILAL